MNNNWDLAADFTDSSTGLTVRIEQRVLRDTTQYSLSMGTLRPDLTLSRYIQDRAINNSLMATMHDLLDKGRAYIDRRRSEDAAKREEVRREDERRVQEQEERKRVKKRRQEENHARRAEENRNRARGGTGKKSKN